MEKVFILQYRHGLTVQTLTIKRFDHQRAATIYGQTCLKLT